jgi:iron complex transport system ATP-binding protein
MSNATPVAEALAKTSKLSFCYGKARALRDVSIELAAGEFVALIGPNGSGKSTLVRLLLGALRGSGDVHWEGRAISSWHLRELSRRVAYLAQHPVYDPDQRVSDVLKMGRAPYWSMFGIESQHDVQIVEAVAREIGVTELLSRRMGDLSGGQRQRVFVGRCFVQQPAAMLLDEPDTHLDVRHLIELGRLLRDAAKTRGMGVLVASHDLNWAAMFADRMVLLSAGEVAAQGSSDAVMEAGVLERVYGTAMERLNRSDGGAVVVPRV